MPLNWQINLTAFVATTMAFVAIFLGLNTENHYFSTEIIVLVTLPIALMANGIVLLGCHFAKVTALNFWKYTGIAALGQAVISMLMLPNPQLLIAACVTGAISGGIGSLIAKAIYGRHQLPSPASLSKGIDGDHLKNGRSALRTALNESNGQSFTFDASLFPPGTAKTLLAEAAAAGWQSRLVSDGKDGDYYQISPR